MKRLEVNDFLSRDADLPILDVRSPAEYTSGHIPNAISLPLFSDNERAIIGTIYKQQGRRPAIKKGLELTGPKLAEFVQQAENTGAQAFRIHCWRGGMRSESMAWLLDQYGFDTFVLEGGYKAYRSAMLKFFDQPLPLNVITGFTGSRKTHLLHLLAHNGEQIVDLEGVAQHQGSSFGNRKSHSQPHTEHFQNMLYEAFRHLDLSKPIWLEDENMRIGQVCMPENLYQQKNNSPHYYIEVPLDQRLEFLVQDYGTMGKNKLIEATNSIRKKLGAQNADKAIELIRIGHLKSAAAIIITYYDKRYEQSIARKGHLLTERFRINFSELDQLAVRLANQFQHAV